MKNPYRVPNLVEPREHWRIPELVRVHGISKSWWYARIAAGELYAIRLGGVILIPDADVRHLLATAEPFVPKARTTRTS